MKNLLAALALALPFAGWAADVSLEVEGLDKSRLEGAQLMVAVFTEAGSWLRQPVVGLRFALTQAREGRITVLLKGLPEGPLAISLFQDTNANGKLDSNALGIPREPYGFSNNATGNFGPPKFEQALVTPVAGVPLRITLN